MKISTSRIVKRVLSGMLSLVMTSSLASALPAVAAEEADCYPYALFASSENDGAITVNAQSFNVNGNIATNGSLFKSGNMNLNGMKSENIGESMPFFVDKIEEVYFSGEYEFYTEDYILVETNVNHSKPIKVQGNYTLDGNINSSSALMAQNNIYIEGNTINANNSVLCAQYGNISIDCSNVNISGLIYAPMGTVEITADNISLNSVVVIADEIVLEANNVNVGYSSWAGQLVGTEFTETPDEEIDYEKDTDEDGIPDFIEIEFGTDINSSDTDNDGLSDLFELVNGTTDPTTSDSDSNGISDADEDYDKDGLTSLEEQETGTDLTDEDSDSDGVTDGDEVNIHNTNPIVKDTDEDGLYDGEEIYFESDPNNKDTNGDGISDGDEKREQTFEYDYSDEDCAVIGVNITMNATGNIYRTTSVKSVMDKDILCSDVVGLVGEPFEIETTSQFDSATITFEVDKTKLGETQFDELIFLWYDEENYRFVEMETTYDEQNSTVSTQTTHFSKYMIVDLTQWAAVWETPIVAQLYEEESVPKYSNVLFTMPAATTDTDVDGFVLSEDNTVSCQKIDIARELFESVTDQQCYYGLYQLVDGQVCCAWNTLKNTDAEGIRPLDFFNRLAQYINPDVAVQIFNVIRVGWGFRNCVEIFFISDNYETDTLGFSYEYYVDSHEIPVYIVDLREGYDEYLNKIASDTGGEYLKNTAENIEYLKEVINERETVRNVITSEYLIAPTSKADTDSDGFLDEQETNGIRIQNGRFITIDPANADSDFDALSDGEEIDTSLCYKDTPVINQKTGETIHVAGYYYVMYSDPNNADTDGDGYMDGEDRRPNWYNNLHFNEISSLNNAPYWSAIDADINRSRLTYETNTNVDFILKLSALKIAFKKAALIGSATPFATALTTDIAWKNVDSGQTPKAYRALLHFFENSGSSYEYSEGEICDLILSHKNNTIHMLDNLALLAQEADDYISNNESIYLSTDFNSCYKALCYYNKDAKCDYLHTPTFESDYCADWYNTFGEANCGMNLYIECVDGVYSMTYRYYIIDMYNWHRTSRLGEILNDMHIAGISKEYLMSGYFEGSLVWQSGDDLSVDSIKKKVYSDMVNHLINDGVVNAGFQKFYTKYNIHNDVYPHYDAFRIKERFV